MIRFDYDASDKLDDIAAAELARFLRDGERAVLAATLLAEAKVKQWHSRPGRGRLYRAKRSAFRLGPRKGRAAVRWHRASAPGDPPAADTGALKRAIGHNLPRLEAGAIVGDIGTNAIQARRLERGGRDRRGIYIAPRPAWEPALLEAEPEIDRIIARVLG